jgi:hypothetical protein
MAEGILIIGSSGSGKSTSFRNLDPKKTFIIQPDSKPLPFKGWKENYHHFSNDNLTGNYLESAEPQMILKVMDYISEKRPEIEVLIIDTLTHIMTTKFMADAKKIGYQKFTDLALDIYNICTRIPKLRKDLYVIATGHPEIGYDADGSKSIKMRTIGKLLDEKIDIPSLFTTVLFSNVRRLDKKNEYTFMTQSDGYTVGKSPMGLFSELEIPNDAQLVIDAIKNY